MTPVLLADDKTVEALVATEFCERSNFFCRRRGKSQQNMNDRKNNMKKTMRHPLKIPHQTITGRPRNCFGEPDSMDGHIRAVNVTDHWYKPSLKSFISSGPAEKEAKRMNHEKKWISFRLNYQDDFTEIRICWSMESIPGKMIRVSSSAVVALTLIVVELTVVFGSSISSKWLYDG